MKKNQIQFICLAALLAVSSALAFMPLDPEPLIKRDRRAYDITIGPVDNGQRVDGYPPSGYRSRPTGHCFNYYAAELTAEEEIIKGQRTKFRINCIDFNGHHVEENGEDGYTYEANRKYIKFPSYSRSGPDGYALVDVTFKRYAGLCEDQNRKYNAFNANMNIKSGQRCEEGFDLATTEHYMNEWPDYWQEFVMQDQFVGFFYGSSGSWEDGWLKFRDYGPVVIGTPPEEIKRTIPASQSEFKGSDIELADDEISFLSDTTITTPATGFEVGPMQWRYIHHIIEGDMITDRETTTDYTGMVGVNEFETDADKEQTALEIKAFGCWYMIEYWTTTAEPLFVDPSCSIIEATITSPGYCSDPNSDPNIVFPVELYIAESSEDGLRHLIRSHNTYFTFTDANEVGFEPYPILFEETEPDVTIWNMPYWDKMPIKVDLNRVDSLVNHLWLSDDATADFNGDGIVNLKDWVIATTAEPRVYPWVGSNAETMTADPVASTRAASIQSVESLIETTIFDTIDKYCEILSFIDSEIEANPDNVENLTALRSELIAQLIEQVFGGSL